MNPLHGAIARKLSSNCVCVLAAGLGQAQVAISVVSVFSKNFKIPPLIIQIDQEDSSVSGDQREKHYASGGLVRVTPRVLLADLLSGRLAPSLINMMLILNCEKIGENDNIVFSVRIFRESNSNAHLLCFTENPKSVQHIQKIINCMYLSEIHLFPRFHQIVQESINSGNMQIAVEECLLNATQQRISDCLDREIEKSQKNGQNFHFFSRFSQILVREDPSTFHNFLMREKEMTFKSVPWWFSQSAHDLLVLSEKNLRQIPTKWSSIIRIVNSAQKCSSVLIACSSENIVETVKLLLAEGPERALLERMDRKKFPTVQNELDSLPMWEGNVSAATTVCLFSELSDLISEATTIVLTEMNLGAIRSIEIHAKNPLNLFILKTNIDPDVLGNEMQLFDDLIRASFSFKEVLVKQANGARKNLRKRHEIFESVIVDTRELRSPLPFVLYKANLRLVLSTLQIGDYILSRDICVERKSVSQNDLQQSLASGRLYKQLVNMVHEYAWPILLLEFHNDSAFKLECSDTGEIQPTSLIAQIISICIHFPSLRIVWSPKFEFTAKIFSILKKNRDQPRSPTLSSPPRWIEFLKQCPGITPENLPRVLSAVKSVRELVSMEKTELVNLLGKRDGNIFNNFMTNTC